MALTKPGVLFDTVTVEPRFLKKKITVEEVVRDRKILIRETGMYLLFGYCNKQWKELIRQKQEGDEIWEWDTHDTSWDKISGDSGISLVRNGKVIYSFYLSVS
ncbi:MAG: hypothetical protein ABSF34_05670 [Verrucomicrobiota bacterium]|jgi:hypothetical protein